MSFFEDHADKIVEVSVSGCWLWMGSLYAGGHGQVFSGRVSDAGYRIPEGAHRKAYRTRFGRFDEALQVCHRCDVPCCVNPDHLFLGTQQDNLADMRAKGRQVSGVKHGMATMTPEIVSKLREEHIPRFVTYADLAEKYGLTESAVGAAVRGETWKKTENLAP